MRGFWRRELQGLEAELRANRPEPSTDLVRSLSSRIEDDLRRTRLYSLSRLSFAGALTVLMLGTLGAFGGLSYAASGTKSVVNVVKRAVAPSTPRTVQRSAAQDQYAPKKITICHHAGPRKRVTITISENALPAHLAHGDTIGPCGGVAGVSATRTAGGSAAGGALGATASQGNLPFTGLALGGSVGLSLLLIGAGVALRRRAGRDPSGP
jgi:hypothetical protein